MERIRQDFEDKETPAVVIMDNFKGQITPSVNQLLDANDIHVCLLPPNTTDLLQPMDLTVNKPAKEFIKKKFEQWYADQIIQQLDEDSEVESLQPVDLRLPILKELGAKWLVEMSEYISNNPQFITSGFIRSGITDVLDGKEPEDEAPLSSDELTDSESDSGDEALESS